MSHITKQKVEIKNANKVMLDGAIKMMVANLTDLEIVDHICDYYGKRVNLKGGIGIKHKGSMWGQEISIKDGVITIEGENMDDNTRRYLTRQLIQFYNAQASMYAMKQMGYQAQMQYANGKVSIRARA